MKFYIIGVKKTWKNEVYDLTKRCSDFSTYNKYERSVGQ
jgi:hypothetical protein